MAIPSAPCRRCGRDDPRYCWQTFRNGTKHIRVECAVCGTFQRYARKTADAMARADASADDSMGLLAFLIALDDLGIDVRKQRGCLAFYPPSAMTPRLWRAAKQHDGILRSMVTDDIPRLPATVMP